MDLPAWAMASLDFASVTNARGSGDNFPRSEDGPDAGRRKPTTRWKLAYSTLFYNALGLAPFMDVLWTTPSQPGNTYGTHRTNIELQALAASLTSRAIGFGDGPNMSNATLLFRFCMSNGTILSPTNLAQPIDQTFARAGAPEPPGSEVWVASSPGGANAGVVTWQVLAVDVEAFVLQRTDLWPRPSPNATLAAFTLDDPACTLTDAPAMHCLRPLTAGVGMPIRVHRPPSTARRPAAAVTREGGAKGAAAASDDRRREHAFASVVVVSVCPSGVALLGEPAKFTAVADRRFSELRCAADGLTASVHGAAGEQVEVMFAVGMHEAPHSQEGQLAAVQATPQPSSPPPPPAALLRRVALNFSEDGVQLVRCSSGRCSSATH
jgi:hypothetical protein